ncbi:MAG: helix-turn-helix transcriptional regulator [Mediterranea massiliensis]|nr:helix-turn-helix transcriptional regulator [Mediterranea massiliensis]
MNKEIAIIEPNTLAGLGLRHLLQQMMPAITIRHFGSMQQLTDDTPDMYGHYFVSSAVYFEHASFFLQRMSRTIVLTSGGAVPGLSDVNTLNVNQSEQALTRDILRLHSRGHGHDHNHRPTMAVEHDLSPREIEVLVLLTRGYINKEIADRLNISLTTVITHRKNITEKLGIKSLSGLTIYAVMRGYVEPHEL